MSDFHLSPEWREHAVLISVRLPDGTDSGGVLLDPEAGSLLVLFAREQLQVGDRVVAAHDTDLTVTGVQHGSLTGQRVTALRVRRTNGRH